MEYLIIDSETLGQAFGLPLSNLRFPERLLLIIPMLLHYSLADRLFWSVGCELSSLSLSLSLHARSSLVAFIGTPLP